MLYVSCSMKLKSWRSTLFLSLLCIGAAIIVGRLFYLQIISHKLYQSWALGQQTGFSEVRGSRGGIFFQNSKENDGSFGVGQIKGLAINKDKWLISTIPANIKDKNTFATALAKYVGISEESIVSKLEKSDSYIIIKKDLSDEQVLALKDANIQGLQLEDISGRYYPESTMASQLVGFLGGQNDGQYGIEGYYDDILKGKKGIQEDKKGLGIINSEGPANLNGSDLYLTIDYNIQFQAEQLLADEKKKNDIDSGQIIVLKPDTGRVLALANFPSFNLNNYSKEKDLGVFQNSAIQKLFEPGSVFKPFAMAIALQEGKITPDDTFFDTGSVTIGPDTIRNFDKKSYGQQTMSGILEKSINTGAVFVSQKIPHPMFIDYLGKLGFDYKTGIDLQGEAYSTNELLKNGSPFGFATASFGQGIQMTPLQLTRAFSIFANGGKLPKPYVVEKITHGQDEQKIKPATLSSVISAQTATQVTTMLTNVVERGFGSGARIPGYYLAGKTGTAQVPFENKKGYYPDKTIQSFIGFGPSLKPQFLILVKLDNPKVPGSSLSAAPIFKKLAQYIINYWQIPPDYDVTTK